MTLSYTGHACWLLPFIALTLLSCSSRTELPACFDLQGHRGAMGLLPENTIPGFIKAAELGVHTVELDLAVSADNKMVVSHEPWFRGDICLQPDGSPIPPGEDRTFRLYELTYEEIRRFDCGSLTNPRHPGQQLQAAPKPLLTEAVAAVEHFTGSAGGHSVHYNIEIKSNPGWDESLTPGPELFADLLVAELEELDRQFPGLLSRINVQSFDPRALQYLRQTHPSIPLALLTSTDDPIEQHLDHFGIIPEIYSVHHGILTPERVQRAKELGMKVIPWTVNTPADILAVMELGVDGVITDYPDRFIALFPDIPLRGEPCAEP